jgi:hypothetical protein
MVCLVVVSGIFVSAPAYAQAADSTPPQSDDDVEQEESVPRWAKEPWEKVRFGLKAGMTWSTLNGALPIPDVGTFGFEGDYGFAAGASFEVPISRAFSIQPELLIVRKHAAIDLTDSTYQGSEKLSVNYFEVPLLAKWYPGERRGTIFSFQGGPTIGLRMDALRESRREDGSIVDVEGSTLVKATDWGLVVGGGVEFHEFIWALTIDFRYNHGLSNIDNSASGQDAKWRAVYAVAGVTW